MYALRKIVTWALVIALVVAGYWLVSSTMGSYVSLAQLQSCARTLKMHVDAHFLLASIAFAAVTILFAAFSIPFLILLALAGGFLFGTLWATLLITSGVTIGSTISFLMIRHFLRDTLQKKYEAQFGGLQQKVSLYGVSYLLILHYLTIIPFFVINTLAALTTISLPLFIMITIAGSGPVFFVYAFAGRELASITSTKDVFSLPVIMAFALLILLATIPMVIKKRQDRS